MQSTWTLQSELTVGVKGNSILFTALAIAPDSKSFIIGDENGLLHIWNLDSKSEIRTVPSPGGLVHIAYLTFSPDGKTLVAIHQGNTVRDSVAMLWNTADWTAQSMPRLRRCRIFPGRPVAGSWWALTSNCSTLRRAKNSHHQGSHGYQGRDHGPWSRRRPGDSVPSHRSSRFLRMALPSLSDVPAPFVC